MEMWLIRWCTAGLILLVFLTYSSTAAAFDHSTSLAFFSNALRDGMILRSKCVANYPVRGMAMCRTPSAQRASTLKMKDRFDPEQIVRI